MRTPECLHGWLPHLPGNRSLRQKMYGSAKVPADSLRKLGYKNSSRNYIIIAKKSLPLDSDFFIFQSKIKKEEKLK